MYLTQIYHRLLIIINTILVHFVFHILSENAEKD